MRTGVDRSMQCDYARMSLNYNRRVSQLLYGKQLVFPAVASLMQSADGSDTLNVRSVLTQHKTRRSRTSDSTITDLRNCHYLLPKRMIVGIVRESCLTPTMSDGDTVVQESTLNV